MSATYFAETDANGLVIRVIVADAAFVAKMPGTWVQTFPSPKVGETKNYAGVGFKYNATTNAFIAPRPTAAHVLDAATQTWKPTAKEAARLAAEFAKLTGA